MTDKDEALTPWKPDEGTALGLWACVAGFIGAWVLIIFTAPYVLPFSLWLFDLF